MTNNKQQTAVEWFANQLSFTQRAIYNGVIEQAKEMEKEQRSIEVPSDEEIGKEASVRHYGTNFKHVFASGATWMRNKIQGNKE
jgi:hypothetical protein